MPGYEGFISIHVAIYTLILFTFGIGILEYSIHKKIKAKLLVNILKNPLIIALVASIFLLIFNIKLPVEILKTIDLLAGGATPIILISLGIFLARKIPNNIKYKHIIALITLKLLIMPLLFFVYFKLSNGGNVLAISVLEAGMPIAITPYILAELYPIDKELIAISIVISCILSVITLPLIMFLVNVA